MKKKIPAGLKDTILKRDEPQGFFKGKPSNVPW